MHSVEIDGTTEYFRDAEAVTSIDGVQKYEMNARSDMEERCYTKDEVDSLIDSAFGLITCPEHTAEEGETFYPNIYTLKIG